MQETPRFQGQRVRDRGSRTESLGQTVKARESRPRNQSQKVKTSQGQKVTVRPEPESKPEIQGQRVKVGQPSPDGAKARELGPEKPRPEC